jgi:hypothetical protein
VWKLADAANKEGYEIPGPPFDELIEMKKRRYAEKTDENNGGREGRVVMIKYKLSWFPVGAHDVVRFQA